MSTPEPTIIQIIPADDWYVGSRSAEFWRAQKEGKTEHRYWHYPLVALALIEVTDYIDGDLETWRTMNGIDPEGELVSLGDCVKGDTLTCLPECPGHFETIKQPEKVPA